MVSFNLWSIEKRDTISLLPQGEISSMESPSSHGLKIASDLLQWRCKYSSSLVKHPRTKSSSVVLLLDIQFLNAVKMIVAFIVFLPQLSFWNYLCSPLVLVVGERAFM